ncbi:MAG: TlpA family protein disulfide reductase [Actinomycetota bacterium]|nr:TlpA family protein disulfide reductase [Actinomycetota bacterium]
MASPPHATPPVDADADDHRPRRRTEPHRATGPRRRHPLMVGTVAAIVALVAALGAAALFSSLSGPPSGPAPEVELRFSGDDRDTEPLVGRLTTGQALPEGSFSMLSGGMGSFADYRGRPLVINFFASWCAPCVAEMPDFEAVHQELGEQVAFLGINLRDQVDDATRLVETTGVTYDVGRDPSGDLATALGVVNMPSTLFVSADGQVVDAHPGALTAGDLRARVRKLLE